MEHLHIVLVATAGKNDTVLGTNVHIAIVDKDLGTQHDFRIGLLDEIDRRSFIPDVDVLVGATGVEQQLVTRTVATDTVDGKVRQIGRTVELGIVGHREDCGVRSAEPNHEVHVPCNQFGVRIENGVARRLEAVAQSIEIGTRALNVVRTGDVLHAHGRVAAHMRSRRLVDDQDARPGTRGADRSGGSCRAQTDDQNVILRIPFDPGNLVGARRTAETARRRYGGGSNGPNPHETAARNILHDTILLAVW